MRITEKTFTRVKSFINLILTGLYTIYQWQNIDLPYNQQSIFGHINPHTILIPITLLISVSLVLDQLYKFKRVKNKEVDLELDSKTSKMISLYALLLFDIFVILVSIGMMQLVSIFYLVNVAIWNAIALLWYRFKEGFNKDYFFYKGYIYDYDQIDQCVGSDHDVRIKLIEKVFFLEVEKTVSFHATNEETDKLQSILGAEKVVLKYLDNH